MWQYASKGAFWSLKSCMHFWIMYLIYIRLLPKLILLNPLYKAPLPVDRHILTVEV